MLDKVCGLIGRPLRQNRNLDAFGIEWLAGIRAPRVIGNLFLIALDISVKIGTGSREDTRDPIDRTRRTLAQKRLIKNRARARIDHEVLDKPVEAEHTGAEEITPQFLLGSRLSI